MKLEKTTRKIKMSEKSNDYRKTYEKDHWSALYSKHARLNVRRSDRKVSTKKARAEGKKEEKA